MNQAEISLTQEAEKLVEFVCALDFSYSARTHREAIDYAVAMRGATLNAAVDQALTVLTDPDQFYWIARIQAEAEQS